MLLFPRRRKKHKSEGHARIQFFTGVLIFETLKGIVFGRFRRETIRNLARKININPITWIFKNMFLKYSEFRKKNSF